MNHITQRDMKSFPTRTVISHKLLHFATKRMSNSLKEYDFHPQTLHLRVSCVTNAGGDEKHLANTTTDYTINGAGITRRQGVAHVTINHDALEYAIKYFCATNS